MSQHNLNQEFNMKHVGKMKNNSARVVIAYRTLPDDPHSALVAGTQGLGDSYHDALMNIIESDNGQQANELADILAVRKFPDGSNMLGYLHERGHLKKVPTTGVLMTPTSQTSIVLSELNEIIARQKGVTIDELAFKEFGAENKAPKKKKEVPAPDTPEVVAARLRSEADSMYKRAKELRAQAEELVPTLKKTAKQMQEE